MKRRTIVILAGSRGFLLSDQEVISWCKSEGFAFDVRVVGPLSHSEIQTWYGLAKMAVIPGGREGGQTSILECISRGVPVLLESNETNRTLFGSGVPYLYNAHGTDLPRLLAQMQMNEEFGGRIQRLQRVVLDTILTAEAEFQRFRSLYQAKQEQLQQEIRP
jgi:hypothetical protein